MPLYDMKCTTPEGSYTGEYLLMNRKEVLKCPKCKEGELDKNQVQIFNIGGNGKSGLSDISVSQETVYFPAFRMTPSGIEKGYIPGNSVTIEMNQDTSKN